MPDVKGHLAVATFEDPRLPQRGHIMKLGICGWGERFLAVFFFWGGGSGVFFSSLWGGWEV